MELEKLAPEKWKAARGLGATATQISVILFAALIASWVGLWRHLDPYRIAIASRVWLERNVNKNATAGIRGRLLEEAPYVEVKPADVPEGKSPGDVLRERWKGLIEIV